MRNLSRIYIVLGVYVLVGEIKSVTDSHLKADKECIDKIKAERVLLNARA